MSLLVKAGITRLSELIIDADKDWQAKEIRNLKAIVAGMTKGDIAYRGSSVLEKLALSYGVGYNFLHAQDVGVGQPEWMDIEDIIIYLTGAVNRMASPPSLSIPVPSISLAVAEDHSGGGFVSEKTLSIPTPSISVGAVADASGGGFTADKTLAIPTADIADDATLLYEKYQTGDDESRAIYGANWEAQTFTPATNHNVNRIIQKIARVLNPGTITVSIRDTAAGLPTGADLVTATFDGNALATTAQWKLIVIAAQALTASTKYAIVVRATGGNADNYLIWRDDQTTPTYAGGARCYSTNSGVDWTEDTTRDFIFEEGVGTT